MTYRKTSIKRRVTNKRRPLINAGGSDIHVLINAGLQQTPGLYEAPSQNTYKAHTHTV